VYILADYQPKPDMQGEQYSGILLRFSKHMKPSQGFNSSSDRFIQTLKLAKKGISENYCLR
jgi:hypothetical protein